MTQASHQLDLMQWLCGMPRTVLARCSGVDRPIVTENEAELLFTYPNGAHGQFIASAHESPGCNILQLCYTKGSVTVRDDREVEIVELSQDEQSFARSCPSPFTQVPCSRRQLHFPEESNKVQQAASIQNFVDAAERGTPVQCPLEDGLHSLQIIHGAYLSQWKKEEAALPVDEKEFRKMLEEQEIR
jgi:predicted dehydrogenase